MTNRTIYPGSVRDIAFKAIILWHGNRLINKMISLLPCHNVIKIGTILYAIHLSELEVEV